VTDPALASRAVAVARGLIIDMIESAGCGHPGAALALAPLGYALYHDVLRINPADPHWPNRDRFVLSNGHASALQYALLHLCGYPLTRDDLAAFRTLGSRTPGHPEHGVTPGVEVSTGPLGQGLATAIGLALAERFLAHHFNRPGFEIVDHRTVVLVSDGDLMEGVSQEAISVAGHLGLGKLVVCYDSNGVTIDGATSLSFSEDQVRRFEASGWRVERTSAYNDPAALIAVLGEVCGVGSEQPALIVVDTEIGYPVPDRRGTPAAHGGALGAALTGVTKELLGLPPEPFAVPADVAEHWDRRAVGARRQQAWQDTFEAWGQAYPQLRREWDASRGPVAKTVLDQIDGIAAGGTLAPRDAAKKIMASLETALPTMMGGSADLLDSTKLRFPGHGYFTRQRPDRNIAFGVREHIMAAIVNGAALHGGIAKPYATTFLAFSDYMRPAVRLSAVMGLPVLWIWTHDSIAIGSDGPTHHPVEHLASLRAMPGLWVFRPADATETEVAWRQALARDDGPVALVLARQPLPILERGPGHDDRHRGGYVVYEPDRPPCGVLLATGSEVHLVLAAARELAPEIPMRVVSLLCWELFEQQERAYQDQVLPPALRLRIALEAGAPLGWHRWVGLDGVVLGMTRFGASADGDVLLEHFGFTVERVLAAVRARREDFEKKRGWQACDQA
jgi:transketolase